MQSVLIVIHILIVVALIGVVLLQRSEGGALGTGGGTGSFMTGRGQANALSRATAILGALFFATALLMSILSSWSRAPHSILGKGPAPAGANRADPDFAGQYSRSAEADGRPVHRAFGSCACLACSSRARASRSVGACAETLATAQRAGAGGPQTLAFVPRRAPRSPQRRSDVRSRRRRRALSGIRSALQRAEDRAAGRPRPTGGRRSSPTCRSVTS